MLSEEVRRPCGLSIRGLTVLARDRSYWRWWFVALDQHSPRLG